ncbi:DUF2567 domain-containing protein [Mycobacterium botniense]|uniref:DUF2567 domain-containing protein n=1 Tax=Mycobacterium botniense TaxID=84962 RepID=A0A7I9Y0P5_9MYCO|nr:DUF2567 domain-containing protein [Mycobacterium botniense]GFG75642.1 hypothetical protein MBOT_30070 [Mycobacterium botniense]
MTARPRDGVSAVSRTRAVAVVVIGLLVTGVLIGGLWAWIAPPIHGVVARDHTGELLHDYPGSEPEHFFVAAVLMLGLLSVVAVVAPVLVWQWSAHRGPAMVAGLTIGLVAAAAAAAAVGAALVRLRYGAVDFGRAPLTDAKPVFYFTQAPPVFFGRGPLQIAATLLLPASAAALVYAGFAAAATRDDLGGHPAAEPQPSSAASAAPSSADSRG